VFCPTGDGRSPHRKAIRATYGRAMIVQSSIDEGALLKLLERDRAKVADMLRGETAQVLTTVLVSLATLEHCTDAGELREGMRELRGSIRGELDRIHELAAKTQPSVLNEFGLEPALVESARLFTGLSRPVIEIDVAEGSEKIREEDRALVFRILEEALRNALTHADARNVSVTASGRSTYLEYAVNDDGRGFEIGAIDIAASPSGLAGMQARASAMGASLEVKSSRGKGTNVLLRLPRKED
jgi:signal transduction histidine kinase